MRKIFKNNYKFLQSGFSFWIFFVAAFIAGLAAASIFWYRHTNNTIRSLAEQVKPLRQNDGAYKYIDPLLGYQVPDNVKEFDEYDPLQSDIQTTILNNQLPGVEDYAVYFRDLNLGRWVGINENVPYAPASMMKVAIMIAYFKEAENSPGVLQKTLQYSTSTADQINGVPFETPSDLQVGKTYTVEQLIEAMIISSDNGAKNALLDNIDQNSLNEIYTDLGLPNPDYSSDYVISAKQYSLLLRILYNATYLSREDSEAALKIMSRAKYSQGLVAGIPTGTAAAQKFGENVDASNPQLPIISLSNCGIIYHPTHPYILCVMTKGSNLQSLGKTISTISQKVWNDVQAYSLKGSY